MTAQIHHLKLMKLVESNVISALNHCTYCFSILPHMFAWEGKEQIS